MSKRPFPDNGEDLGPRKKSQTTSEQTPGEAGDAMLQSLRPSSWTKWTTADIPSQLPPLPPILDPEIERDVFTHPGVDPAHNYDWLEFLGDSQLEMLATIFIHKTFEQGLRVGRGSQLREQIVRNSTLADFCRQYKMDQRARIPKDIERAQVQGTQSKRTAKDILKIHGDIFEAYVAGVIISDPKNGVQTVAKWLKSLWAMTLRDQIKQEERRKEDTSQRELRQTESSTPVADNLTPKDVLAKRIKVRGVVIRYEEINKKKDQYTNLPLFVVGAFLDGWGETNKLLGIGSALQKKEAGQIAATRAMENKKLMKVYEAKKKAFMESVESKVAAEGITGEEEKTT